MIRRLHFIEAGACTHRKSWILNGAGSARVRTPATVIAMEHATQGIALFDTGYSPRFREVTRHFPEKLYALMTPVEVTPEETALHRLKRLGISADDVRYVICSHFHADHIAGVADFPKARYVFAKQGFDSIRVLSRWGRLSVGFLSRLLPDDFDTRSLAIPSELFKTEVPSLSGLSDFRSGHDLFGDGSIILIALPGHAAGQIGAIVRQTSGDLHFLAADACWSEISYQELVLPSPLIVKYLFEDATTYQETLRRIHAFWRLHPEIKVVPCHCPLTLARLLSASTPGPPIEVAL